MKISVRHREGVTILDLQGKVTIGAGDIQLRDAVREALDAGARNILLDMRGVKEMDSSGIGELVSSYTTVANRGHKLALEHLPPRVSDILQMTQLYTVFDIYDDEDNAVEELAG